MFDHVIVVAGREYLVAAGRAARDAALAVPVNMDDWMRPAVSRGFWIATAAAGVVLVAGLASVAQRGTPLATSRSPSPR